MIYVVGQNYNVVGYHFPMQLREILVLPSNTWYRFRYGDMVVTVQANEILGYA